MLYLLIYRSPINTIDGFQGQEREIVYISLVRSNDKGEIGFLKDYRRINVAMTRAKKKLILIGDSATIGGTPFYEALLNYCEQQRSLSNGLGVYAKLDAGFLDSGRYFAARQIRMMFE